MYRNSCTAIVVVLLQLFWLQPALAADEALARAQFMLRQMSAEKNQLAAENRALASEKQELQGKLAELEKKYHKLAKNSENSSTALSERIDSLQQKLKQEAQAHGEASGSLQQMTDEKNRLFSIARKQTDVIDLCVANNRKLYAIDQQLLGKYEEKGVWSALIQDEPFTGMKQVEIENLVDDYQYRLDDLRVEVPETGDERNL